MKTIDSQKIAILGAILAATLAAGCFGGPGYSNQPYGYNGGYGNAYPYNSGYSYPQTYGNAYNAGYQNGERADASRDSHQDRDQHVEVVTRDHDQTRTEKQPPSGVRGDDYSRKDSQPAHTSATN
ncbi:MAG TPA: hypothetical protein VJX23_13560 [Candidatus Binataceae bacterium]|nr:hypothetical protein [Candidatus Binataceae bacterium]